MTWYISFCVLSILIVILFWHLWCKFKLKDTTFDVILENKLLFTKFCLAAVLIVTVLCVPNLWEMSKCNTRSVVQKMETQFSWIYGECQVRNKDGSFVNIDRLRAIPTDGIEAE